MNVARLSSLTAAARTQQPTLNSENTGPANVTGVSLQEGFGVSGNQVLVSWTSTDTAHQLVSEVHRKGDTIRVTVGDYRDPNQMGAMVISQRQTPIDLKFPAPAGTKVVVVNQDQKVLFEGTIQGNP